MTGIVLGSLFGVGLIVAAVVYWLCFRKKYNHHHQVAGCDETDVATVKIHGLQTLGRSYAGSFNTADKKVPAFLLAPE